MENDLLAEDEWLSPTLGLRFVMRDGRRILQQAWETDGREGVEWHDVPLVPGEGGAPNPWGSIG